MAQVWAARHRGGGAIFALKMLMPHLAEDGDFHDMFFDEARIASRIHHENVARTFELAELDGILTLVMEWVDGSSLVHMLRPDPEREELLVALPVRHAARIIAETCAGLHAAHELLGDDGRPLAVVHRDVSPHNILLMRDGRVKVTDFGVAKAIGKSHMTMVGQVKGKLAYMSPEQLVGGAVDRRSDIFALGSVLYESTVGQRPFQGEHDPQIMAAIVTGDFIRPSEVIPGYPRALEEIVMRALSTDPDARYATALQLKEALEGWLAASGPAIDARHVSILLQERCGAELDGRLAELSLTQPPRLPAAPGPQAEPRSALETARHVRSATPNGVSAVSAIIAMLVGALLGLGVLALVSNARRERRAAAELAKRDDALPNPASAGTTVLRQVTLHVPYDGARLFVDGRELPAGSPRVMRPDAGVVTVLVKAEAREDTIVEVRPTSPEKIEVAMPEKPKPKPTQGDSSRPDSPVSP
jgi:serine/threonine-protein kinase